MRPDDPDEYVLDNPDADTLDEWMRTLASMPPEGVNRADWLRWRVWANRAATGSPGWMDTLYPRERL